jgi:hypothetical protein
MDVVAYEGGVNGQNVYGANSGKPHNLGVVPELIIVKNRGQTYNWHVKCASVLGRSNLCLNLSDAAPVNNDTYFNDIADTATHFHTRAGNGFVNTVGNTYLAYLFATLPGISKVGSYSGSSSAVNVDCGFTNGARFVLIKRTNASGNWFVFDTTRGIVSVNDPALWLNSTNAQITNTDYIDPLSSGFTVTTASGDINESGGTYLFLAIA